MTHIYLIARREFLSYVATWGFWLSMLTVPIFMAAGFIVPQLFEGSTPTRYYTIVAEDAAAPELIEAELLTRQSDAIENALAAAVAVRGGQEASDRFNAALDQGAAPQAAAREAGLEDAAITAAEEGARRTYRAVPPPARTPDALRPYLTGAQGVETPEGPQSLHAALFVSGDAQSGYALDYWSTNLSNQELMDVARRALSASMGDAYLNAAGVDPSLVDQAETLSPEVRALDPAKAEGAQEVTFQDRLPYILGVGAGFVLWSVLFSVVNMLLTSTIEEKGNKILEVLMSSARLTEILTGKLLGVAGVSFTLIGVWLVTGIGFLAVGLMTGAGQDIGPVFDALLAPRLLLPFFFYFLAGYLMYGAIFLAIGALCETIQEAQTFMSPLIIILMIPMGFLVFAFQNLDSPLLAVASWIPIFTPFLMIARLPADPPMWEILGTSALLLGTLVAILFAAAFVFRLGALGQVDVNSLKRLIPGKAR